ncbi:hypothetical protein [Streptomyces sp. NPDC003393]
MQPVVATYVFRAFVMVGRPRVPDEIQGFCWVQIRADLSIEVGVAADEAGRPLRLHRQVQDRLGEHNSPE